MKYLTKYKLWEWEIYNGSRLHYNGLKPVNAQIFDKKELVDWTCNDCHFQFKSPVDEDKYCKICGSEDILRNYFHE